MKKILVLGQPSFIADFEVTVLTCDVEDMDFGFTASLEQAIDFLDKWEWDEFVVLADFLESLDISTIQAPVTSYARNAKGLEDAAKERVKSYGIVHRASELLKNITNASFVALEAPEPSVTDDFKANVKESERDKKASKKANTSPSEAEKTKPVKEADVTENPSFEVPVIDDYSDLFADDDQFIIPLAKGPANSSEEIVTTKDKPSETRKRTSDGDVRSRLLELRKKKNAEADGKVNVGTGENAFEPNRKAEVITVYSAKGGVGKTTLACNLATFLALTASGRDHFRVAIIDFDIDFGDVLCTLGFSPDRICMTAWVKDIRERINDGEEPEDIEYSEREVRSFMQKKKESGLYALLAPLSCGEAVDTDITEEEIRIMLKNTVEHGGFDYVVVDTGNNIRDASVIPIEVSDHLLIVLNQSVNTANCCYGFIKMMNELGFDMSKLKIVINGIRPGKAVGITVSELEEVLIDPSTGEPFKCIGKLDDDNDVRASVNDMVPLVYRSNHDYTKSIGHLASEIIGEEHVLESPKKDGLFKRFLKKQG